MSDQFDIFVNQRLPLPGLLAWGAFLPDGSVQNNGYHDGFRSTQFHSFLSKLGTIAKSLAPEDTQGVHFCWTFQMVRIYSILNSQGIGMMLFFRNDERIGVDSAIKVLDDFDKLEWT